LSVFKRRCLPERIPEIGEMRRTTKAWNLERNSRQTKVDWQFTTEDARIKLKRLYPKS
jgi:predicted AAA+ superfamily ATPase